MSTVNATTTTATNSSVYPLNEWGGPVLPAPPAPQSMTKRFQHFLAEYVLFFFAWPFLLLFLALSGKALSWNDMKDLYRLVQHAHKHPIDEQESYQDPTLLQQVYESDSAQPYLQGGALEWQQREGYCGPTTLRCLVKSFPNIPAHWIPSRESLSAGAKTPEHICTALNDLGQPPAGEDATVKLQARALPLDDVSYETFLKELQSNLIKDKNTRVALNYLRPALFGWYLPMYLWPIAPTGFFASLFGGHFSFILGTVSLANSKREELLVAVFDVNHKYGGTYLVPARRLYESIKAKDIMTQRSRALIFVTEQS